MEPITWNNEKRRLGDLIPWERNPRQITEKQAKHLQKSLEEFGMAQLLLISPSNHIYDGHQREAVMQLMDSYTADTEIDVRVSSREMSEDERRQFVIRINANRGEWNYDELANLYELDELDEWGFDELDLVDWGQDEEQEDPGPQVDKAEELREKWDVSSGQLWALGNHRVIVGDCTDAAVVERLMGGESAEMCFTSPPYNAGVSAQLSGNTNIGDNLYRDAYDDNQDQGDWLALIKAFTDIATRQAEYTFVNLQYLAGNKMAFIEYLNEYKSRIADIAVWDKKHAAPAAALRVMDSRFEFVIILSDDATRAIGTRDFRGMVHNVYEGSPQRKNEYASSHAATFPVDFPEYFIGNFTNRNEWVYDGFLGTGTTLIACENLNRKCYGVEIEPKYVAVTLERWHEMTGKQPELIDG